MKTDLSGEEIRGLLARLLEQREQTEKKLRRNPYNFFYQGKSVAYAEVLKILKDELEIEDGQWPVPDKAKRRRKLK
ncbi:MAG: hypothetical protein ACI39G_05225 [Pseudoramibacter sp.]